MKKLTALALAVLCALCLFGCASGKQEETTTWYFSGAHEYFTVSNCSVVLSDSEQKFYGGELTVTQPELFDNVTSYSTCFYTLKKGAPDPFHSTTTTGLTDNSAPYGQKLGSASSTGRMISNLEEGLWFELRTINADGTEQVYQIELKATD